MRGGIYSIYLDPSYTSPTSGQTFDNQSLLHAIPQCFYTYGKKDFPLSLGLGIYSPFGLGLKWPQNTGFRSLGTDSSLTYATINPVVAFKVLPHLSLAAGLMVNYANLDLQQGLTPVPNNDVFRFTGDGWNVGYNLGVLWQPYEKISLGATFRSGQTQHLTGKTESEMNSVQPGVNSPASADYPFPLDVAFGVSWRPTPKWNLEFDADYTDWSVLQTVTIRQAAPPPILPFPNIPVAFDWQSSWYYEFGATRYFDNGWHVSAGYVFNQNAIPDAYYTPLVTDLDKHFFSIGAGYKGEKFDFDVAYQFGYGPTRTVTGSPVSPAGQTADGNYEFISQAISVSVGWHF